MKNLIVLGMIFCGQLFLAQNVILNKVEKTHSNTDKFLYKVDPITVSAEYLGELEVQGFSNDDAAVFGMIYKKAKEIGANSFAYQPYETIEGGAAKFDAANYKLALYYVSPENLPHETNSVYLIASPSQKQTISFNKQNIVFQPRTYTRKTLIPGTVYTVSTRKFLGSAITLSAQENQPVQYFQFSAFSINSNPYGNAGINLKSGDITKLERSYAEFLTTIYQFQE